MYLLKVKYRGLLYSGKGFKSVSFYGLNYYYWADDL